MRPLRFQAQAPDWELRDEARRIEAHISISAISGKALCLRARDCLDHVPDLRRAAPAADSWLCTRPITTENAPHTWGWARDAPLGRAIQRSGTIIATPIQLFFGSEECTRNLPPKLLDDILGRFCDPFLKVCDDTSRGLLTEKPHLQAAQRRDRAWSSSQTPGVGVFFPVVMVARLRRRLGPAQKRQPYECYSEARFRHPDRQKERRQLRSLLHPHGGDCASRCAS